MTDSQELGEAEESGPDSLGQLLRIFELREKTALVAHCKQLVVAQRDLVGLILTCAELPDLPIRHLPIFQHHQPSHLRPTEEDRRAIATAKLGPLEPRAAKAFGKIGQMFVERRMFCSHLFWEPASDRWHFFYFDQRDVGADSHWRHGSHIHLINWLTHPKTDPNDILAKVRSEERPKFTGSIHVRFVDDSRNHRGNPVGRADSDFAP